MSTRRKAPPWDAVCNQIVVTSGPRDAGYTHPSPVTEVELDERESHLGRRLPERYRVFMKRFGPGEAAELIRLTPLGVRDEGSHALIENTKGYRNLFRNHIPEVLPPNAEGLCRLVYFADDFCGDAYPSRVPA